MDSHKFNDCSQNNSGKQSNGSNNQQSRYRQVLKEIKLLHDRSKLVRSYRDTRNLEDFDDR